MMNRSPNPGPPWWPTPRHYPERVLRRHAGRTDGEARPYASGDRAAKTPSQARRRARYELRPEDLLAADKAARDATWI